MSDRRWTIGELAAAAAGVLERKGFASSRLDADLLLAHCLEADRLQLYTRFDMPVDPEVRAAYRRLVERRLAHEPVAYILGRRDFMDWTFRVTPDVLIPRPETEHVVEAAAGVLREHGSGARLLEIGVGSGCLVISLLKMLPELRAVGVDLSPAALEVARSNGVELGVDDRVTWVVGDRFEGLEAAGTGEPFAAVASNPPYVTEAERAELAPDVRDFEPAAALFWPGDGLEFHRRLIAEGRERLAPGGALVLELPGRGGTELTAVCAELAAPLEATVRRDHAGRERVLVARDGRRSGS